jgi:hypothetical protein
LILLLFLLSSSAPLNESVEIRLCFQSHTELRSQKNSYSNMFGAAALSVFYLSVSHFMYIYTSNFFTVE